ncbi:hypothetical protein EIP86_004618 [Pleurotus ostreatoroseus]|nr:hypothetical protein EIP86_004618 [Pleurotus ostreatoroseus]
MDKIRVSVPPNPHSLLPPALVYAVLLIDLAFSNDPARGTKEQQLLAQVLQTLSADFTPGRILHNLQAEVLVSYYLFHKDRRIEGGYHAAAAVSIAVASSLHKIRSPRGPVGQTIGLPPAQDAVEEGERINAFWTVFVLDRCWTVWMQSPSVLIDETSARTQIDTPWPLDMAGYEQNLLPPGHYGGQTVQAFLSGMAPDSEHQSLLCLRAKASILYEKSAQLAAQWDPNNPAFQARFGALDARIDQFKAAIPPPVQAPSLRPDVVRSLLAIHTLCQCATIQLHAPLSQGRAPSNNKALAAASAAVAVLQGVPVPQLVYVDPIMGNEMNKLRQG